MKLRYQMTFVAGLTVIVLMVAMYFFLKAYFERDLRERIKADMFRQASLARTLLEDARVDLEDKTALYEIVRDISDDLALRVTVMDNNGVVIADSSVTPEHLAYIENHKDRPEVGKALAGGMGSDFRKSSTVGIEMFYVAHAFATLTEKGIVRLAYPLEDIKHLSDALKKVLFLSLAVSAILGFAGIHILTVRLTRPLEIITRTSQRIAGGDFSVKIPMMSGPDEIHRLAESFNSMSVELKRRIDEAINSRSRLETVFLSMMEGVMLLDEKARIVLVNKTLRESMELTDDIQGQSPLEAIRNIDVARMVEDVLAQDQGVIERMLTLGRTDPKIFLVHGAPVRHEEQLIGAVLVFHNVTELKRLENIRKEFVANVSHELRTPVTSIRGYAETLLDGAIGDPSHASDFVRIIHEEADRLNSLIEDLLALSRIESGRDELKLEKGKLGPVIERVRSRMTPLAVHENVTIIRNGSPKDPETYFDPAKIEQVLVNLIDNAIKYNKPGGSVEITLEDAGAFVRVGVKDTGIGIPKEDIPRIFERFYRVDKARSREMGGTGLGLAIVKHIIASHKGQVAVESTLGQGSVFSFTLPKA